ncbi:MAG: PAS domain-containing protein [Sphingomonas sp.]
MSAYPWIDAFQGRDNDGNEVVPLPASWECDLATDGLRWSPGVYDLFGLPRDARLRRDAVVAMYVDDSRAELDRLRTEAIERCGSFTFDAQIRRADGALRWIRITADVITKYGRAMRLYGTKQDVTAEVERREA